MMFRKGLAIAPFVLCGIFCAVTPLKSADEPAAQQDPPPPKIVTRLYDIRTLIAPSDDFPFETSPHAPAFVIPPNLQGADISPYGNGSGGNGGGASLFGSAGREKVAITREELAEQLTKSITDLVESDSWRDSGGTQGSIREMNGILIVRQSEAAQKEIADLLKQISVFRAQPIRTTADWLLLTSAEFDKLVKPSAKTDSGTPREVDLAVMEKLLATAGHFHAELPGHNGQTLHVLSGHEKSVTINAIATVGTGVAAYTPIIGLAADGVAIQVTPVVDYEQKNAVVTLFSTFNEGQEQGPTMTLRSYATTQPSPGDSDTLSVANATYHEVSSTVQEFRTTLRIPLNTPVIAGAMTIAPTAKQTEPRQLVLIVNVRANEESGEPKGK